MGESGRWGTQEAAAGLCAWVAGSSRGRALREPGFTDCWGCCLVEEQGQKEGAVLPVHHRAAETTFPPTCLPMADANDNLSPGSAKPDESTAVNRPGGVKALLQQLNTKHSDSHVQLPDGTTLESSQPGRKFVTPRKPARWEVGGGGGSTAPSPAEHGAARGGGGGGASGVKARLAEISAKYSSSHVQLPDGSVLSAKRPPANEEKPREASTQGLPEVLNGGEDSPHAQDAGSGGGDAPILLQGHGFQPASPIIPGLQEEKAAPLEKVAFLSTNHTASPLASHLARREKQGGVEGTV